MQAVNGEWSMRGRRLRPCCVVSAACARWLLAAPQNSMAQGEGSGTRTRGQDRRL